MHAHGVEIHRSHRAGWLRAAVLGANDGIVSTASLVLGVAAAEASRNGVLTAGLAGLVAIELEELTQIYRARGVDAETAECVATQLMKHDALEAHARDELGIFDATSANPLQAALASGATFALGAAIPLTVTSIVPNSALMGSVAGVSLVGLAALGALGARAGGAAMLNGAARVTTWGALAMLLTSVVGRLFGGAF